MPRLAAWVYETIALSVTAVWLVLNVVDATSTSYSVPADLHLVAGVVVGGLFGGAAIARRRDGDGRG